MRERFDKIILNVLLAAAVAAAIAGILIVCLCLFHSIAGVPLDTVPATSISIDPPQVSLSAPSEEDKPVTYDPDIPLGPELQSVLQEACGVYDVPECLVLGLIEVESRFQADAVSSEGCVGLMQINPVYAWKLEENTGYSYLTPEGNLHCGIWYLSSLIEKYGGSVDKALVAYNQGSYQGVVTQYAKGVLEAADRWGEACPQ